MKNKTLKNLIALGFFAFSIFGVNSASAYINDVSYYGYDTDYSYNDDYSYNNSEQRQQLLHQKYDYERQQIALQDQLDQQKYNSEQQKTLQQQNLDSQKQQLTSKQSVSAQQPYTYTELPIKYAEQPVTTTPIDKVSTKNNGQYVSYDGYDPNMLGASAYGYNNDLTALSMKGSGSFMPSSVFQWIMLVLLILAIIVIARMIARRSAKNNPHTVATH